MQERLKQEIEILRNSYPEMEYAPAGQWIRIPSYPLPPGWTKEKVDVVFQIPPGYPGTHPYGIYVPAGLRFKGAQPQNFTEPAQNSPPFKGEWGFFSWQPNNWNPSAKIIAGSNLWAWVRGFGARFKEGV